MSARSGRPRGVASALLGMLGVAVVAGLMITVGVAPAIALTGVGAKNGIGLFQNLPAKLAITPLDQKTRLYAKDNGKQVLLASFFNQDRDVLTWSQVPAVVKNATLAAEDVRFYQHGPIDPNGIARALVSNFMHKDIQGASTISQQYVKNVCVQQAEALTDSKKAAAAYLECTDKSYNRKIREMRLAIGLEKKYSKNEILLGYLNIAGFGGRVYGIEAASEYYYGKSSKDLTIGQAATLISIVNNPDAFRLDLKKNLPGAEGRRNYVLGVERSHGMITDADYEKYSAEKIVTKITPPSTGCQTAGTAGFFCDYVEKTILASKQFGATPTERFANLNTKGWKIYTTLDLSLQKKAKATMTRFVPAKSPSGTDLGGAAVTVQVGTGKILSMVQSKTFNESQGTGKAGYTTTALNWNVDHLYGGSTYGFQPGSTYKLFTLLDWFKNGHGVYETVNGNARTLPAGDLTACGKPAAAWSVGNDTAGEGGIQTVFSATARSVNGAFASMAEKLDLCDIQGMAKALDVHRGDGTDTGTNPSSILGTTRWPRSPWRPPMRASPTRASSARPWRSTRSSRAPASRSTCRRAIASRAYRRTSRSRPATRCTASSAAVAPRPGTRAR